MKTTPLIILSGLASLGMGAQVPDSPRPESGQTQTTDSPSVPPVDDRQEQASDYFGVRKLFIPDIRHWLTCEIVDIQPQKDDTLLMTCRFTNHSTHEITILNRESILHFTLQDRQLRKVGDPGNADDLLPLASFGCDSVWYQKNQYCLMEELPEWTIKPSASLMVTVLLQKFIPRIDSDEQTASLNDKNGQEETVTYVYWPLEQMGRPYPDAMYFLFPIPRVRIETGEDVIPYQTGIYAIIPPPYRRPFPHEVDAHGKAPPLLTWEDYGASSAYGIYEICDVDDGVLPLYLNALLLVRDRASADTCASNIRVNISYYIENSDLHVRLDEILTECQLNRTALQYLHYRWSIMQRQIGQVLDALEKADYYGSVQLKAMAPMIRKECASFPATLEKYMQNDAIKKNGDACK